MILNKDEIKKILVIKFGGIGDVLLMTPVLSNLRAYFPNCVIYLLTLRKSRDILVDNPYMDRVITYDPNEDGSWCLIKNIRKQKWDLVIDLYSNPRTALITWWSGAKYRFGFDFRGRSYAYNIKMKGRGSEVHNVDFNLDALIKLGIPVDSKKIVVDVNIVHEEFANDFFKANNLYSKQSIAIGLTGGWETKKFKPEGYIKLIKAINQIYDVNFVLIWGNTAEKAEAEKIHDQIPENTFIIPDSPIRYLAAILKNCTVYIGNDSGPMHIAESMDTPVLGIYGPTNPKLQGPYGDNNLFVRNEKLDCLECNLLECPIGNICMTELEISTIIDKLKKLIQLNHLIFQPKH